MKKPISSTPDIASRTEELSRYPTKKLHAYVATLVERVLAGEAASEERKAEGAATSWPPSHLTHAQQIMLAAAELYLSEGRRVFAREDVRDKLGLTQDQWMAGYTAIFQGMRSDQPGGAPSVPDELRGVFRQVSRGRHTLTREGEEAARALRREQSGRHSSRSE